MRIFTGMRPDGREPVAFRYCTKQLFTPRLLRSIVSSTVRGTPVLPVDEELRCVDPRCVVPLLAAELLELRKSSSSLLRLAEADLSSFQEDEDRATEVPVPDG